MARMLRIGTCTVCNNGNIGVRVAASAECVVGMCDECDAVWLDPTLLDGPHFPAQPELPCPKDGSSLRNAPAHWATRAEASAAGWVAVVIGETTALGAPPPEKGRSTMAPIKPLSSEELDEIRTRCERAAAGPWTSMIEGRDHTSGSSFIMTGPPDRRGQDIELSGATSDDQDFIAHARQDLPRLLDEATRLQAAATNSALRFGALLGNVQEQFRQERFFAQASSALQMVSMFVVPSTGQPSEDADEGVVITFSVNAELRTQVSSEKKAITLSLQLRHSAGEWIADAQIAWTDKSSRWDPFDAKEVRASSIEQLDTKLLPLVAWVGTRFREVVAGLGSEASPN